MDAVKVCENVLFFFCDEKKIKKFEDKLLMNESKLKNLKIFFTYCIAQGTIGLFFGMVGGHYFSLSWPLLGIAGFFCPFVINYLYQDFVFEKRKRQKEEVLAEMLLEASVFCDKKSMIETIKLVGEKEFGLLSKDFEKIFIEIKNGASVEEAVDNMKRKNNSVIISRIMDLFEQGYSSGAKMSLLFKETAEELLESSAIIKERQAVMLVTKYTLLLASMIIVPAILGLMIGLVGGMNFSSMEEFSLGMSGVTRSELFNFSSFGAMIYVFEYALLGSFFLGIYSGNKKQFWLYGLMIVPVASIVFFLAQFL